MDQTRRVLRIGLVVGLVVVAARPGCHRPCSRTPTASVLLFGLGEGVYMLGAGVLLVLGAEGGCWSRWLPACWTARCSWSWAGRPTCEHVTWDRLAATPVLALALAVIYTRRTGPRRRLAVRRQEWLGRCRGRVRAGRGRPADLPRRRGAARPRRHQRRGAARRAAALAEHGRGRGEPALVPAPHPATAAHHQRHAGFGTRARLILVAAVLQYVAAAAILIAAAVVIAERDRAASLATGRTCRSWRLRDAGRGNVHRADVAGARLAHLPARRLRRGACLRDHFPRSRGDRAARRVRAGCSSWSAATRWSCSGGRCGTPTRQKAAARG